MENLILKSLKYFSFFDYPPNLEEIYTFLRKKTVKKRVEETLADLERQNKLKKIEDFKNITRYLLQTTSRDTLWGYGNKKVQSSKLKVKNYLRRQTNSINKLNGWRFKTYIRLLIFFPQIKLVGFSGSISMMNADEDDDIDLFIITAKKRLFTGRLIALFLAEIFSLRRRAQHRVFSSIRDKVCLNLIFDESDLVVPKFKRSEYVAHEVLQMKPIINKDCTYERFLSKNLWVFKIFPNAEKIFNFQFSIFKQVKNSNFKNYKFNKNLKLRIENFGDWVEMQLKNLQLFLIDRHKTNEIVTSTQLWFHPEDFGKKIKS